MSAQVNIMAPESYDAVPTPIKGIFIGAHFRIEGTNKYEVYSATEIYDSADKIVKLETESWNEVKSYINSLLCQ